MEREHLPAVIQIHRQAFRGYKSSLLGSRFLFRFYEWFLTAPEAFGFVAIPGAGTEPGRSAVCGFAVGARVGSGPSITRYTAPAVLRAILERPWLAAHPEILAGFRLKLQQMLRHLPEATSPSPGDTVPAAALVGIGVAPGQQGRGVGRRLLEVFEQESVRRGYSRARLGVRRSNTIACRLYRQCGWEECSWLGTPGTATYVKLLVDESGRHHGLAARPVGFSHE